MTGRFYVCFTLFYHNLCYFVSILPPLLRTFYNLPPTSPTPIAAPLTHVIHSLITIPITPSLKPIWFGQSSGSAPNHAGTSPKSRTPQFSDSSPGSRSDSPVPSNSSPTSPKPSTLDRALSVLAAGRRSLSRTPSPSAGPSLDILQRAFDLLDAAFTHYFPGDVDPDDLELRQKVKAETSDSLDDMLSPLVVLVSRFCIGDEGCKVRVRQWIVPDDLDRTSPLEERADILGRCLRLLSSVYHPCLKDAVGEMLYAIADSDGQHSLLSHFSDTKLFVQLQFSPLCLVMAMSQDSCFTKGCSVLHHQARPGPR